MSRFLLAAVVGPLLVLALVATSCARSETLGPEEAVEVMVLDGVDRGRATCVVSQLDGRLDLEKVTGLSVDLSEAELGLLGTTSAVCAPLLGGGGGVVGGGQQLDEATVAAQIAAENEALDIEGAVAELIEDGLDPDVGRCLSTTLRRLEDPGAVLDDVFALAAWIVDCREQLDADAAELGVSGPSR